MKCVDEPAPSILRSRSTRQLQYSRDNRIPSFEDLETAVGIGCLCCVSRVLRRATKPVCKVASSSMWNQSSQLEMIYSNMLFKFTLAFVGCYSKTMLLLRLHCRTGLGRAFLKPFNTTKVIHKAKEPGGDTRSGRVWQQGSAFLVDISARENCWICLPLLCVKGQALYVGLYQPPTPAFGIDHADFNLGPSNPARELLIPPNIFPKAITFLS